MKSDYQRLLLNLTGTGIGFALGAVLYWHAPWQALFAYPAVVGGWWIARQKP